ncbi:MAG: DUF3369 domain-containing protein [Chromatiales bacterium]|nr:DUF3369 domain-containing protein [Chromatiales bacterium]
MIDDSDELLFSEEDETEEQSGGHSSDAWKIMIVDDEQSVHDVTVMVLRKFQFQGRPLEFLHAHSGAQANQMMREHPDTALMLLDVVMEEDDAGLKVAKHVREELKNHFVRIVLRTGQPGQAPEERVIETYDINDYKEKTELTTKKLFTTIYAALRSYRDIITIDRSRAGLERIIDSSANMFRAHSMDMFVSGLMMQILSILGFDDNSFYSRASGFVAGCGQGGDTTQPSRIVVGTGAYEGAVDRPVEAVVDERARKYIRQALQEKSSIYFENGCVIYFHNHANTQGLVYLTGCHTLDPTEKRLLDLFCANISIAYDNVTLNEEIEETQKEIIYTLGTVAEFRSNETGAHVVRVAKYTELLARLIGLDDNESTLIKLASPMHDIGKIAIPDSILLKPSRLTDEEYEFMKKHTEIGYDMLKHSRRPILQAAATIAWEHQEKWDGSGYPRGLKGKEIHLYGRLTAIADVFDALDSSRYYKEAWAMERIVDYFKDQRGRHFDPDLTDIFLANIGKFQEIRNQYKDEDFNDRTILNLT